MVNLAAAFTAMEIEEAVSGRLLRGRPEMAVSGVSTDTRSIESGALFVPLVGPNFDGHDYLPDALAAGAAGALIERGRNLPETGGAFAIEVADTLYALGELARYHRARFDLPAVAVTGSNGKTTTKEMIAAIFSEGGKTLKSEGNLNNLIGLPHQVFRLIGEHTRAVFEMGMNRPGEIQRLAEIAAPGVAVITSIAAVHLEGLGSIEGVRDAKGELLDVMGPGGVAVLCADDEQSNILADRFRSRGGRVLTFGFSQESEVRGTDVRVTAHEGTGFLLHMDGEETKVRLPAVGRHNVMNALAAAAAASAAGSPLDEIIRGLSRAALPKMRLEIEEIPGHAGCFLLNDAYNANPASVVQAIETADLLKTPGRVFGILGDMKELGASEEAAHREIGRAAAAGGLDFFAGVGCLMALAADEARRAGMTDGQALSFDTPEAAAAWAKEQLRPGDWVLVKGSRSMRMERAVEVFRK
jgi:UDP-N-acetylmuramoyl-tripeptide--D-alanyl-D-alanine ligase